MFECLSVESLAILVALMFLAAGTIFKLGGDLGRMALKCAGLEMIITNQEMRIDQLEETVIKAYGGDVGPWARGEGEGPF